jgi:RND family efflux transporter MFP subunit
MLSRNLPAETIMMRFALLPFLLVAVALAGCTGKNQYAPPPPPEVTVATPVKQQVRDYLEITGKTQSSESVDIRSRVSGYLKSIEFKDGQTVTEGQLLFVIEPEPFKVALASAKAELQKAEAKLALAEADVKRSEPLVDKGAVSEQEWDVIVANRATAKADVAAATSAVSQADLNLSYTEVKSPIAGRISRHMVDVGNLVQVQTTMLTNVQSVAPIHALFHVSENELKLLRQSPTASNYAAATTADAKATDATTAETTVKVGLSHDRDFPYEGKIDFAELGVDPNTGKQLRRAVIENKDGALLPGLFVRVRVPVGDETPQLMVADRSIATDQRGDYVLVVNDKNIVEYRPVELGLMTDGLRVVKSGIKEGDWIVTNGLQRARPGATVRPSQSTITAAIGPASSGKLIAGPEKSLPEKSPATESKSERSAERTTPAKVRQGGG